jgi:hypothetical protein
MDFVDSHFPTKTIAHKNLIVFWSSCMMNLLVGIFQPRQSPTKSLEQDITGPLYLPMIINMLNFVNLAIFL